MKKKGDGFVRENFLAIILSVIVLFFLILLAVRAWGLFGNSDTNQAQKNIEKISDISNSLADGDEVEYLLLSPEDWALTGWPVGSKIPKDCSNKNWNNCICMCHLSEAWFEKYSGGVYNFRTIAELTPSQYLDACDTESFCKEVKYDELLVNPFKIPTQKESSTPIVVNKVVENKQSLFLKREGNKLTIEVK